MTRKDASKILKITHKPVRISPVYVAASEQREPMRAVHVVPEIAPPNLLEKLERLEKLATELSTEVHRHDIDIVVEKRIRAIADQLLSLVERHEASAAMRLQ